MQCVIVIVIEESLLGHPLHVHVHVRHTQLLSDATAGALLYLNANKRLRLGGDKDIAFVPLLMPFALSD